ncbi:MAG: efflux RND transporter periplasmic adaptor subunit [Planctomycetota bacterium]
MKALAWRRLLRLGWRVGETLALFALLVVLMLWLAGAFGTKVQALPPLPDPAPRAEKVAPVERLKVPLAVEQQGTVRPRVQATVASRLLARVEQVRAEVGQSVQGPGENRDGQVLVVLDARDLQAATRRAEAGLAAAAGAAEAVRAEVAAAATDIEAAHAELERARADLERTIAMHEGGAATAAQLDQVRAAERVAAARHAAALQRKTSLERQQQRVEQEQAAAESALNAARVQEGYATVRAPFTGVVARKLVEVGDTVAPSQALVELHETERFDLVVDVAERLALRLTLGEALKFRIDALAVEGTGQVREMAPATDTRTRTVRVKITLEGVEGLVGGTMGRLSIPTGETDVLVIPRSALRRVGQLELVDVTDEAGRKFRRFVTVGRAQGQGPHGENVEVLSGLAEGEKVVVP